MKDRFGKEINTDGWLRKVTLYKSNLYDSYYDDNTIRESREVELSKIVKNKETGKEEEIFLKDTIFKILRNSGEFRGWAPAKRDRALLAVLYNNVRDYY